VKRQHLGSVVRDRRESLSLSQGRLASIVGVSPAQISRLESGERDDPGFALMLRLSEALNTTLDDLAGPLRADRGVDAEDWLRFGFDEVYEIVPGRLYEVWGDFRRFRISITRAIERGSTIPWNSSIDEAVRAPLGDESVEVWISPAGIPARLRGETPTEALRDAMHWLADWGGFDEIGRARRDAAGAQEMEPDLREVVDTIDEAVSELNLSEWRDRDRARWSNSKYDVYVSRSDEREYVMMTYFSGEIQHAKPVVRFPMSRSGALKGAERIRAFASETQGCSQ